MRSGLRKAANIEDPVSPKPGAQPGQAPEKPAADPQSQVPITQQRQPTKPAEAAKPPVTAEPKKPAAGADPETETQQPQADGKTGKAASPWKLVDQYKSRYTEASSRVLQLEKELEQARQRSLPEDKWNEMQGKLKEHEDFLRFHNYKESQEFKTKYQEPYEKMWKRAMTSLSTISATDAEGNPRQFTGQDLVRLCNMDGPAARKLARETWGDDAAPDIMAAREKIVDAHTSMQDALEDAKKNGAEREKQQTETRRSEMQKNTEFVRSEFQKAHEGILAGKHAKWLNPTEGDEEGNTALEKGFAFARDAFAQRPLDPNLSPEQRASAAKKHAALIARAAAFTRLTGANSKLEARIAELETKLKEYDGSVPGNGAPGGGPADPGAPTNARDQMFSKLRKLAA